MQRNDNNRNGNDKGLNSMSSDDDAMKVGERTFRKTKFGLAEEEVRSYVQELLSQRDALLKRQEHLAALTQLAEKTVIEANNLSQLMMKKSAEQAKAEVDKIRTKAEEDSKQMIEAKKTEAKAAAEKEAEAIKVGAQQQAKLIREEQLSTIKVEAANLAQKLQNELLANIDSIKKEITSIGSKLEPAASINMGTSHMLTEKALGKSIPTLTANEKGVLLNHIPWLEVEVLPPLDIEQIMDLISRLESLPEVKTTDLLPETPNPLIRVFLNEPSPLADMLRSLPQIEQVNELSDFVESDIQGEEKRKRIQIVLGKNANIKDKEAKKGPLSKIN
jgi:F0F1-type ATP synthase membrane subunit b/b'